MCEAFYLVEEDISKLVLNCSDWVKDHPLYRDKQLDEIAIFQKFTAAYQMGVLHGVVAVDCIGSIQGALLVLKANDLFTDENIMYEALFYVHPFYRSLKLVRSMVNLVRGIAKYENTKTINFGVTSGYQEERVGKLYEYLGFKKHGGTYVMEV